MMQLVDSFRISHRLRAPAAILAAMCFVSLAGCYTEVAYNEAPPFEPVESGEQPIDEPVDIPIDTVADVAVPPRWEEVEKPRVENVRPDVTPVANNPSEPSGSQPLPLPSLPPVDLSSDTTNADEQFADSLGRAELPDKLTDEPTNELPNEPRAEPAGANEVVDNELNSEVAVVLEPTEVPPTAIANERVEVADVKAADDDWPAFLGPRPTSLESPLGSSPPTAPVDRNDRTNNDLAENYGTETDVSQTPEPPAAVEVATAPPPVNDVRVATAEPRVRATPVVVNSSNTRHVVWLLASKLSFALLAGDDLSTAAQAKQDAEELAKVLQLTMPNLPEAPSAGEVLAIGRTIGEQISSRFGPDHAALAEIAVKTNILLAVYDDRPEMVHPIAGATSAAAVRAGVADPVWRAWQTDILGADGLDQARAAIFRFQQSIERNLSSTEIASDPLFR